MAMANLTNSAVYRETNALTDDLLVILLEDVPGYR